MKISVTKIGGSVLLVGLIGLVIYAFQPNPVDVDIAQVVRGSLRVTVDQQGKTRIKERFIVSTPLGGELQRIHLHAGDSVVSGQTILAAIEPNAPNLLDVRLKGAAEARVKATEAAKQQAESTLLRAKQLHQYTVNQTERLRKGRSMGGVSAEDYDTAENRERIAAEDVRGAQFAVRVATFEHELAQAALLRFQPRSSGPTNDDRFEIRCPINGKVLRVFQESAAVIPSGTKLLEIGDPTDLEMEIDVLSIDAVRILPGAKVVVEHWGGPAPLQGRVRVVEPSAFLKISALGVEEQRVNVIADFIDPVEKRPTLGDAYRIEARIVTWEANEVLKIPHGALFRCGDSWCVYLLIGNRAKRVPITVGQSNGLEAEVLDGLAEGDTVILYPSDRVKEGVKVLVR